MDKKNLNTVLRDIYDRLLTRYGPRGWWPASSPFEVIVGAILTQSTAWVNVEKAIGRLRETGNLTPDRLHAIPEGELAGLIRSSGYYNAKARKLKSFIGWLYSEHEGSLENAFAPDIPVLRRRLLSVHGIGEETADSIILYAAGKPVFVIDAYTQRIISRLGIAPAADTYATYQALFTKNLPADTDLFNDYHAQFVNLGKNVCRKRPLCEECVLANLCHYHGG